MPSFRDLPGIDALLRAPALAAPVARHGAARVKAALRALQAEWREQGTVPPWAGEPEAYAAHVSRRLGSLGYRTVFNLTGTIIHTNLGRAPLSEAVYREVEPLVTQPLNLEYDLARGTRGDRDATVATRLAELTGAEAATVVNNNAAALMLVLNSLARGRAVAVSRGELIEIGGSFRLPQIMERADCRLLEVGTTNRTHLEDYAGAIAAGAALLLKVHPSNYRVSGFTREVGAAELAALGRERDVPVCVDLGSGTLVDLARWGLPHEPMPQELLAVGVDLVTFSGDKLLGSVQSGLVVGAARYIDVLQRNPMKRALRPDKLTLAFLDRTLALYEDPEQLPERLPLLRTLTTPDAELCRRAERVAERLAALLDGFTVAVEPSECQIGSGSLPEQMLPSRAVTVRHAEPQEIRSLAGRLRGLPIPVIGRINRDALWLDARGAERLDALLDNLGQLGRPS